MTTGPTRLVVLSTSFASNFHLKSHPISAVWRRGHPECKVDRFVERQKKLIPETLALRFLLVFKKLGQFSQVISIRRRPSFPTCHGGPLLYAEPLSKVFLALLQASPRVEDLFSEAGLLSVHLKSIKLCMIYHTFFSLSSSFMYGRLYLKQGPQRKAGLDTLDEEE